MKSDIEILQEAKLEDISSVAERIGIDDEYLEQYGRVKAKVDLSMLNDKATAEVRYRTITRRRTRDIYPERRKKKRRAQLFQRNPRYLALSCIGQTPPTVISAAFVCY